MLALQALYYLRQCRLSVCLTQYRRVTDGQTDGIAIASTALAKRRAVKK